MLTLSPILDQGILLRHSLGETPNSQIDITAQSPDIILSGQEALQQADMAAYVHDYTKVSQDNVQVNQDNYVYLRGLNTTSTPATARLWLYYMPSDLFLWPQNWKCDAITGQTPSTEPLTLIQNWTLLQNTAPEAIALTGYLPQDGSGFILSPQGKNKKQHYSVIAYVENNPDVTTSPPKPPKLPSLSSIYDLITFLDKTPEVVWKNTVNIPVDALSMNGAWTATESITGPATKESFEIGFRLTNMPTDGFISFQVAGPDERSSINYPMSAISASNMDFLIPITWPANYKGSIRITYWTGDTALSDGSSIELIAGVDKSSIEATLRQENRLSEDEISEAVDTLRARCKGFTSKPDVLEVGSIEYAFTTESA